MSDPKRLRDGAYGEDLRALVRAAEEDVLDDEAVARLRTRLAAVGVAASGTTLATGKTSALRALGTKLVLVVGAGALAVAAMSHFRSPPTASAQKAAIVTPIALAAPTPVPSASSAPVVESISVTDLPRPPATSVRVVSKPPPPATTSSVEVAATPREGLLLLRARRALPTDPARALSLVREHEAEFPESQLAPEREKIRHEAEANGAR